MKFATYERFRIVCKRHGISDIRSSVVYKELVARYSEEHRHYHNLEHIDRLLSVMLECSLADDELEFAIWFHDVIYEPREEHNERKSADYFLSLFGGDLWNDFSSEVERLIVATDPTRKRRGANREDLIIDICLSILGADSIEYRAYSEAIRKEYSFVSEEEYRRERSKFLNSILENQIFVTEHFIWLEKQARSNITAELDHLSKKKSNTNEEK